MLRTRTARLVTLGSNDLWERWLGVSLLAGAFALIAWSISSF
jgi:hypothetical protein